MFSCIKQIKFKMTTLTLAMGALLLSPTSAVICLGSDGHVAVEAAFHSHCRCNPNDPHQEQATQGPAFHGERHGHCNDFPVHVELALDRNAPSPGGLSDQLISAAAGMGAAAEESTHTDSLDLITHIPCHPISLSSVILRL